MNLAVSGCNVIADSIDVDGTPVITMLVQSLAQPVVFVGLQNYFAHYSAVFRKAKVNLKAYVQVESDWAAPVLPLTETAPITYRDAPHSVSYADLPKKLKAIVTEGDAIVVDSLAPVFFMADENPWLSCLAFVNSLREIAGVVIVSVPKDLGREFLLLKQVADLFVELLPITSGYSQELSGQIVVSRRSQGVLREDWTSYYRLGDVGITLID